MTIASEYRAAAGHKNNGDAEGFKLARAYRATRRRLIGKGFDASPARCLSIARADVARGATFYGEPDAKAGAPGERGGRWMERPEALGLRFVGFSDEIGGRSFRRVDHTGWFLMPDGDGGEVARGCVYQLPARNGQAVYVEALRTGGQDRDGAWRDMGTQGGAYVFLGERHLGERGGADCDTEPAMLDAASGADDEARIYAEKEREYQESYAAGQAAGEADEAAAEARRALLALLADIRARFIPAERSGPVWESLSARVAGLLETISTERGKRDSAWRDCPSWAAEPWKAGFMDATGFARAVRLGYASRDDWQGAPEANPCGPE